MEKSTNLEYIGECLGELNFSNTKDSNNKKILSTIVRFLNREFGTIAECDGIQIIDNTTNQLFGMTIAPSEENLNKIIKWGMLSGERVENREKFKKPNITNYIIELDSKLGLPQLNLSNTELAAILIHEIGHIVLNSKFIDDMSLLYIEEYSKKNVIPNVKDSSSDLAAMLYVYNYITKHQLMNEIKNMSVERDADKFVIETGFGPELYSALDKFAKYYSLSANNIYLKSKEMIESDREDAKMYIEYSKSFNNRKSFIKDVIGKEIKTTKSNYWKNFLDYALKRFNFLKSMVGKKDKNSLSEGLITRLLGLTPNITKKDIDEISIEIEMIETYEDKMYLVRKIHSKIDDINQVLNMSSKILTDDNKKKISQLSGYKSQLEKMLNEVLKRKIKEKQYSVFVKAPKGYEG